MAGEYIAGILCCRGGRGSSQASCHPSMPSHDDFSYDPYPPMYVRYVKAIILFPEIFKKFCADKVGA